MARDLDDRQQAELTEFVNALAEAAGYTTTAQWARDSDYPASNLSNLRNGRAGVDGYNLLRLIRAAAARVEASPQALSAAVARALGTDDVDEKLAGRLKELSDLVTEALSELRERSALPEAQQPAPAAGRTRKKA